MKLSSRPPRTPSKLSDSLHHQLNMYALAASAAGVGAVASAQSAEAKVIYTPTHVVIGHGGVNQYYLHLTHSKVADLEFLHVSGCYTFCYDTFQEFPSAFFVKVLFPGRMTDNVAALKRGAQIGPTSRNFFEGWGNFVNITTSSVARGSWVNVKDRYMGIVFPITGHGAQHYAWARMSVKVKGKDITAILTGYAYETVPNKAIIAGKTKGPDVVTVQSDTTPGSLGTLALGRR